MIAEQFDVFFLDLDGVVYLGEEPLPRSVESVARLYEMGKKLRFLTNDPRPTRSTVLRILNELNIDAQKAELNEEGIDVGFFDVSDLPSNTPAMHPRWITDAIDQRGHPVLR